MAARIDTDEVSNQSPPYAGRRSVRQRPAAAGGGGGERRRAATQPSLSSVRPALGLGRDVRAARLANENPPTAAQGERRSSSIRPITASWPRACGTGLHASTWRPDGTRAAAPAEVARAARFYMVAQVENGHMCPITMTRAAVARARGGAGAARSGAAENRRRASTTRASGRGAKNPASRSAWA